MGEQTPSTVQEKTKNDTSEKTSLGTEHLEETVIQEGNLIYDGDEEPEIHMRTWIALAAMFLLNYVQVVALQGPPAVLSYIGTSLNNPRAQTWVQTRSRSSKPSSAP